MRLWEVGVTLKEDEKVRRYEVVEGKWGLDTFM